MVGSGSYIFSYITSWESDVAETYDLRFQTS